MKHHILLTLVVGAFLATTGSAAHAACVAEIGVSCGESIAGDTSAGSADVLQWGCLPWSLPGAETAYFFERADTGPVRVQVQPVSGLDVGVAVLTDPCEPANPDACIVGADALLAGAVETVTFDALAGRRYTLAVDGQSDGAFWLQVTCGEAAPESVCDDGLDDDSDGFTDCDDLDCGLVMPCRIAELDCADDVDDDGDGLTDCDDDDCAGLPACGSYEENCADGVDEDLDGATDCDDDDCAEHPVCATAVCAPTAPLSCGDGDGQPGSTPLESTMDLYACGPLPYTGGEGVFAFSPDEDVVANFRVAPSNAGFDAALILLEEVCSPERCVALRDFLGAGMPETLSYRIAAGNTVYLVIDGYESSGGDYSVSVTCDIPQPELDCGNGLDDDGDGPADCDDSDCAADPACVGCEDDEAEDDDRAETATFADDGASWDARIVTADDDDWYRLDLCAGASITVDAVFAHSDGDVTLTLVDADGEPVAVADSDDDDERLEHAVDAQGDWFVIVSTLDGFCVPYDIQFAVDRTTCGGTVVEPTADVVEVPEDVVTPPEDAVTPPEDIVATPEDIATPPEDIATPPEDIATPPEDIATPPEDIATPPEDIVTPPEDIVAPSEDTAGPTSKDAFGAPDAGTTPGDDTLVHLEDATDDADDSDDPAPPSRAQSSSSSCSGAPTGAGPVFPSAALLLALAAISLFVRRRRA